MTSRMEQAYRRCRDRATGLAFALLHSEEDARDVVQEVFARLCESRSTALHSEEIANLDAFIYRSVRNSCINHINKMNTRERIRRLLPLDAEMVEDVTEERIAAVQKAADTLLSQRENEVVHQVFGQGRSYREAAELLHLSTSSINKHIVNSLRKLRQHFNTQQP